MNKAIKNGLATLILTTLPVLGVQAGGSDNHAAIFAGGTYKKETDPTVAIEYEYRTPLWSKKIGVGLVAERIFADKAANLVLAGVVVHPWQGLKINIFSGTKFVSSKTKTVFRGGLGYDFHYDNISYGPIYNVDRIKGDNYHVFGIAVGVGF